MHLHGIYAHCSTKCAFYHNFILIKIGKLKKKKGKINPFQVDSLKQRERERVSEKCVTCDENCNVLQNELF